MPIIDETLNFEEMEQLLNPAPKGRYRVRLIGFRADEDGNVILSSEKCLGYIKPIYSIVEEGPHRGKMAEQFVVVKPKSREYAQLYKAFPNAITPDGKFDTDLAIGMECLADIGVDTYEGNSKNVVRKVLPIPAEDELKL